MFGSWMNDVDEVEKSFNAASPFPHVVIDNFLEENKAKALLDEFPSTSEMPRSRDYVFGEKRELSSVEAHGGASAEYYDAVMGSEFREAISRIVGAELFVDPAFHGGGFHQSGDGGYLDTHVDFNVHPEHPDWLRTLNILLYLNEDWKADYDGRLLIRSHPEDAPTGISPIFNRGVLMLTNDSTFHGFERMELPTGVTRKSIATYAYQRVDPSSVSARTTGWAPAEAGLLKRSFARNYDFLVRNKNRLFGSGTSKNR